MASGACTEYREVVVTPASTSSAQPGTVPEGDGGRDAAPVVSPQDQCAQYVDCVAAARPSQASGVVALYGSTSPCWKGTAAEAEICGKACAQQMAEEAKSSKLAKCGYRQCPLTQGSTRKVDVCIGESCCDLATRCADATQACGILFGRLQNECGKLSGSLQQDCEDRIAAKDPGLPDLNAYFECLDKCQP
jgi:hypothetical protein